MSIAGDFIHFVKSSPREVDGVLAKAKMESGLQCPESDFTMAVGPDLNRGGLD